MYKLPCRSFRLISMTVTILHLPITCILLWNRVKHYVVKLCLFSFLNGTFFTWASFIFHYQLLMNTRNTKNVGQSKKVPGSPNSQRPYFTLLNDAMSQILQIELPDDRQSRKTSYCPDRVSASIVGAKNMHSSSGWAVTNKTRPVCTFRWIRRFVSRLSK